MQTCYQIKSQSKSFAAMPIAFAQYSKYLHSPNHIFNLDPFACQFPIQLSFGFCQLMQFAVFQWQNYFFRFTLQSPICQIIPQFHRLTKLHTADLKQFVVLRSTASEKCRGDFLALFINNQLCFQRVSLFLAAVKSALFFFGRSISRSVTSTIVYLIVSSISSRFLPGKENFPDLIKISSISRTSRETFDS